MYKLPSNYSNSYFLGGGPIGHAQFVQFLPGVNICWISWFGLQSPLLEKQVKGNEGDFDQKTHEDLAS